MAFSFATNVSALSLTSLRYQTESSGAHINLDRDDVDPMASSMPTEASASESTTSSTTSVHSSSCTPSSNRKRASTEDTLSMFDTHSDVSALICADIRKYKHSQCGSASPANASTSDDMEKSGTKRDSILSSARRKEVTAKTRKAAKNEKKKSYLEVKGNQMEHLCKKYLETDLKSLINPYDKIGFVSGNCRSALGNPLNDNRFRIHLNYLRKKSLLCDVKVVCRGTVFNAHCAVLEAFSNLLASLIKRARIQAKEKAIESCEKENLNTRSVNFPIRGENLDVNCLLYDPSSDVKNLSSSCILDGSTCVNVYRAVQVPTEIQGPEEVTTDKQTMEGSKDCSVDTQPNAVLVLKIMRNNVNGLCVSVAQDMTMEPTPNSEKIPPNKAIELPVDTGINKGTASGCNCDVLQVSNLEECDVSNMVNPTTISNSCPILLTSPSSPKLPKLDLTPLSSRPKLDLRALTSVPEEHYASPDVVESPHLSLPRLSLPPLSPGDDVDLPPLDLSLLPSPQLLDSIPKVATVQVMTPTDPISSSQSSELSGTPRDNSRLDSAETSTQTNIQVTTSEEFSTKSVSSVHNVKGSPRSPAKSLVAIHETASVNCTSDDKMKINHSCGSGTFVCQAATSTKKVNPSLYLPSLKQTGIPRTNDATPETNPNCQEQTPGTPAKVQRVRDNTLCIKVNVTEPDVLDVLLEYAYTGHFKKLRYLPVTKFCEVNYAARKMEVYVNVFTPKVLRQALSSRNFLDLWDLADYSHNRMLVDLVAKYVAKHLDTLWMSDELPKLSYQRLVTTLLVASRCPLKTNVILRAILSWLKRDVQRRSRSLKVFLPFIQQSDISREYAAQLLGHDDVIQWLPLLRSELVERLRKTSSSHLCVMDRYEQLSALTPGSSNVASSKNGSTKSASGYSTFGVKKGSSRSIKPLVTRLSASKRNFGRHQQPSFSEHDDVHSDFSQFSVESTPVMSIEKHFSEMSLSPPRTKTIRRVKKIPDVAPSLVVVGEDTLSSELVMMMLKATHDEFVGEPIHLKVSHENQQTITFFDGYIILVGGERTYKREKVQTVTVCDIRSNWRAALPNMHLPRSNAAVFLIDSTLYVTGGEGRYYEALSQVESLEMRGKKLKWKIMPCMKSKRSGHSIVRDDDGCAYVVGGGTNKCERYVPSIDKWFDMPSLPQEFSELRPLLTVVDRKLVAVNYYRPSRMYVFDLDDDNGVWHAERLTGSPPNWIVSITSWRDAVFVLEEKLQMIYSFTFEQRHWQPGAKLARAQFKPLYISVRVGSDCSPKPEDLSD